MRRAIVMFLLLLGACSSKSSSGGASSTVVAQTSTALSDAATVYCKAEPAKVTAAARALAIAPTATVDERKYGFADGSRDMVSLRREWEVANSDPANLPHVDHEPSDVVLVTRSPWEWYSPSGFARACEAAYGAR